MREIKFRCWDKDVNKMWLDVQTLYDCKVKATDGTEDYPRWCDSFGDVLKDDKLIIMQYTGLKDKKGKEIYEGDILQLPSKFLPPEVVTFKYGMFYLINDSLFHYADGREVIGNIWENGDLLEKK